MWWSDNEARKADGIRRRWCKPSRPETGGRSWAKDPKRKQEDTRMNTISFDINNDRTMKLIQRQHDGATLIVIEDAAGNYESISDNEAFISPGDFIMLINFFRHIKSHDYQHDFINPNGTNTEAH